MSGEIGKILGINEGEYAKASRVINRMLKRITSTNDRLEMIEVLEESEEFFLKMKREQPQLYRIFNSNYLKIKESGSRKLLGIRVTID